MSDDVDAVIETMRERAVPSADERAELAATVDELIERTQEVVADLEVEADVMQVGSTARDTWLPGERDIDIFVRFPESLSREELESAGLTIGHQVLPESHEEYAEHPYVVGEFAGFQVDIVPCYDVDDAAEIRSAVDRTPFHTRYIDEQLTAALAREVCVCKQFFTGIGVYGSNLRRRGFSGYLTELLVLEYGGFRPLLEAGADWNPPVRLDPEDHGSATFDDSLVVIDPTDPERNVAAVLSDENLARFQHFARQFLAEPSPALFEPIERDPIDESAVRAAFEQRGTTPLAITFEAPAVVEDQLWPQLDRSMDGIATELERRGFDVFRTDAFVADGDVLLLLELAVAERPHIERHVGPPVGVRKHAKSFYDKYADEDVYGPFITADRYVVERDREFVTATAFLESDAFLDVALGKDVEQMLEAEFSVVEDVATLADQFGREFARYLDPNPRGM